MIRWLKHIFITGHSWRLVGADACDLAVCHGRVGSHTHMIYRCDDCGDHRNQVVHGRWAYPAKDDPVMKAIAYMEQK